MNPGRRSARRVRLGAAAGVAAAMIAACGGGTSQFEPFVPDRYVAFGDETSAIESDGRRYAINPLNEQGAISCASDPIWTQSIATRYAFVFEQCNPGGATTFKATMRAAAGARVDDLQTQIDAQLAGAGFAGKTLATVLLGANDLFELYAAFPTQTEEQLVAEARARGERVAAQVNRLVQLGARVIVSTVPDLGLTPYALQQKAAHADTDRAALISRLTAAFNARLRVNILNDGRYVGLVLADEMVQTMVRVPAFFAINDATTAACVVALPDCTTQTLASPGAASSWLWADDRHLAYGGQLQLGVLALARANGNPF